MAPARPRHRFKLVPKETNERDQWHNTRQRKVYSAEFMAKVALKAVKSLATLDKIIQGCGVQSAMTQ